MTILQDLLEISRYHLISLWNLIWFFKKDGSEDLKIRLLHTLDTQKRAERILRFTEWIFQCRGDRSLDRTQNRRPNFQLKTASSCEVEGQVIRSTCSSSATTKTTHLFFLCHDEKQVHSSSFLALGHTVTAAKDRSTRHRPASIPQHTSAYMSLCHNTSAYVELNVFLHTSSVIICRIRCTAHLIPDTSCCTKSRRYMVEWSHASM